MRYGMVIDLKKCIGCYGCQVFCKTENATPPGVLWSRVLFYELGRYPKVKRMPLPVLCMHCETAACVDVCITGASIKGKNGIVTVNSEKCAGCLNCVVACPYGARFLSAGGSEYFPGQGLTPYERAGYQKHRKGTVEKCDFCMSRVEKGLEPACVKNCMAKARIFGDLDDPKSEVFRLITGRAFHAYPVAAPGATAMKPEMACSVYYLTGAKTDP